MFLFTYILLLVPILHLALGQVIPAPPIPPGQVLQVDGITGQGKVIYTLVPLVTYQQQWIQQGQRQLYSIFPLGKIQPSGVITLADGSNLPQGGFLVADGLDAAGNVIYRVINVSVYQAQQALCADRQQFVACGCQRPRPSFGPKLMYIPPIINGGDYILLMVQANRGNNRLNPACQAPPPIGPPISPCSILIPTPCGPILVPGQPSISIQPGTVIIPGQPGIIIVPINGQILTPNSPYLPIQPGGIIIPNQPCTVQIPGAPGYPIQPGTIILGAQAGQNWNNLNSGRLVLQGESGKPAVFVYPGQNLNPNLGDNGILNLQSGSPHPHPLIYPSFVTNFDQSADLLSQYISPPALPNQPIFSGGMSVMPSVAGTGDKYGKTTQTQYKTIKNQTESTATPQKLKSTTKKVDKKKSTKATGKSELTTLLNLKGLSSLLKANKSITATSALSKKGITTTIKSVEKTTTKKVTPKLKVTESPKFLLGADFTPDIDEIKKIIPDILSKPEGIITDKGATLKSGDPLKPQQHLLPIFNHSESDLFMALRVVNQTEYQLYQNLTLKPFKYNFNLKFDDVLPLILPNPSFEEARKVYPTLSKKPIGRIYPEGPVNEEDKPLGKGLHFLPDLHEDGVVLFRILRPSEWMGMIKEMGKSTSSVTEVQVVTAVATVFAEKTIENPFKHVLHFMH
ncbi:unnamed protein product [Bursaphelenchus xylophilus]|uniref:(pine wood nematode) hypothetical protein n=1 Tax=Bursaphelenchus xylophilus TaxID=6326 RepID=A0A1I7SL99_BURXY|nr:unnamed protein product [Bursaphelenchus xylophilus]CAG9129437.1 unnamed protein product [Bursaphelenchus xylophilus]